MQPSSGYEAMMNIKEMRKQLILASARKVRAEKTGRGLKRAAVEQAYWAVRVEMVKNEGIQN